MPKIGVMGGTFDPIHIGHLIAARAALESFALDRVIFIPAALPPHKMTRRVASPEHRLSMVKAAIEGEKDFSVSDMEFRRQGPSYTVDTAAELKKIYNDAEIYFIIGTDSANELDTWYEAEKLIKECRFVALSRPGAKLDPAALMAAFGEYARHVRELTMPGIDISSTLIRERIRKNLSVRHFVPDKVADYIEKEGLYR